MRIRAISAITGAVALLLGWAVSSAVGQSNEKQAADEKPTPKPIDIIVTVKATPGEVWQAYTTNDGLHTWMSPATNVECRIGGPFEIYFNASGAKGERGSDGCAVLSYLPNEMFSYSWNAPPKFAHARQQRTWVVVTFAPLGEKETKVRLVHLGWDEMIKANPDHADEWREVNDYFTKAWTRKLNDLKQRFESGPLKWEN